MSGGGPQLSAGGKKLASLCSIGLGGLSIGCFFKAFPFSNVFTSVLLIIAGILLAVITLVLLILISISGN